MTDSLDFDRLFKLQLVVARHGEMDGARWWNTSSLLGPRSAAILRRGFGRNPLLCPGPYRVCDRPAPLQ